MWRAAVILPEEIRDGICDAVLAFMVEEGVAVAKAPGKDVGADDPADMALEF